jgi:subtilisin-like proprotein convertase family protein
MRTRLIIAMIGVVLALPLAGSTAPAEAGKRFAKVTKTFSNGSPIAIPADGSRPAAPYPSTIDVRGLKRGKIFDVNVTLHQLSHAYPDDIDVLLVAPNGRNQLIMSDAGGGTPITNITLTLDDEAAPALPDNGPLQSGSYWPNNYEFEADPFAPPAPAPPTSGSFALSTFNGSKPNGTWQLFIVDDTDRDVGELRGGWSLQITAKVQK